MDSYTYQLIYPEKRLVSAETILGWHANEVVNSGLRPTEDVDRAILELEDLGLIAVKIRRIMRSDINGRLCSVLL